MTKQTQPCHLKSPPNVMALVSLYDNPARYFSRKKTKTPKNSTAYPRPQGNSEALFQNQEHLICRAGGEGELPFFPNPKEPTADVKASTSSSCQRPSTARQGPHSPPTPNLLRVSNTGHACTATPCWKTRRGSLKTQANRTKMVTD